MAKDSKKVLASSRATFPGFKHIMMPKQDTVFKTISLGLAWLNSFLQWLWFRHWAQDVPVFMSRTISGFEHGAHWKRLLIIIIHEEDIIYWHTALIIDDRMGGLPPIFSTTARFSLTLWRSITRVYIVSHILSNRSQTTYSRDANPSAGRLLALDKR